MTSDHNPPTRGTCRVCGATVPLDRNGRTGSHRAGPTLPDVECGGTGYFPR